MKNEEAPPLIDSNNIETKKESLQKSSIKSEIIISKEEYITNELSKKIILKIYINLNLIFLILLLLLIVYFI